MAKRRGNNEGTVFKTTKGKWRAQVSLHGKRLSFTANTQWECQEWIKKTLRQKDQGYNLNQAQTTLQMFLNGWLISITPNRAASTIATYRATAANEIIPHIGKIKLKDLRPDHIQKLYDLRLQQGGTP